MPSIFRTYFADALARLRPLAADRLVDVDDHRITATSRGRLLLRIIAMCFDRYRNEWNLSATEPRFSRAI
jgi:Coproporphyrinogen III oxidase and related Fe-S oxidoreductases